MVCIRGEDVRNLIFKFPDYSNIKRRQDLCDVCLQKKLNLAFSFYEADGAWFWRNHLEVMFCTEQNSDKKYCDIYESCELIDSNCQNKPDLPKPVPTEPPNRPDVPNCWDPSGFYPDHPHAPNCKDLIGANDFCQHICTVLIEDSADDCAVDEFCEPAADNKWLWNIDDFEPVFCEWHSVDNGNIHWCEHYRECEITLKTGEPLCIMKGDDFEVTDKPTDAPETSSTTTVRPETPQTTENVVDIPEL